MSLSAVLKGLEVKQAELASLTSSDSSVRENLRVARLRISEALKQIGEAAKTQEYIELCDLLENEIPVDPSHLSLEELREEAEKLHKRTKREQTESPLIRAEGESFEAFNLRYQNHVFGAIFGDTAGVGR